MVDSITTEVIHHRLISAAKEMIAQPHAHVLQHDRLRDP